MSESSAWQAIDSALGSEYLLIREAPQQAGFTTITARSKIDGSTAEIRTVSLDVLGHRPPLTPSDISARRIQHPNVIPVLSVGATGDTFYWISPSIEGRTLRSRLSHGGKMLVKDVLVILRDVSAGLTHAHRHGLVHGGLTPDSIVISGGSALLTDAGIPEVFTALRRSSSETPLDPSATDPLRYSAPEQAEGSSDARSDVYAWGVIAYELLAGRHPFAGRTTPPQIMAAHAGEQPPPMPAGADVPASVTRLVNRCLSKDPSSRPESAHELLGVMTAQMLVAPPAPKAGSGQKAIIALMLAAVLVIAVITWLGIRP